MVFEVLYSGWFICSLFLSTHVELGLPCRYNTGRITFQDISWTDSNPLTPLVCLVLSLGLYLTSCFNTPQNSTGWLFPGETQDAQFLQILAKVLIDHEEEVTQMGFKVSDIGTHSIQKGAVSYLALLPLGPPAAAMCIRAGWTMGKVKDIYMRYLTLGD
jgi:hypothetical protein